MIWKVYTHSYTKRKKTQHTTKHRARIDAKHVYFVHWRSWFGDMSTEHTEPIERNSEIPKSKWKHLNSIVSWFNDAQNFWLPENQLTNIIYAVSLSARRHSSFKWKNTFQDERKVFRLKYSNAIGRCELNRNNEEQKEREKERQKNSNRINIKWSERINDSIKNKMKQMRTRNIPSRAPWFPSLCLCLIHVFRITTNFRLTLFIFLGLLESFVLFYMLRS